MNRFDALRLALATMVFVYHAVALSGHYANAPFERGLAIAAELCIQGFFIVSGALVFGSWERSRSLADYASKRVRRLYPAYLVVILVPALISAIIAFGEPNAWRDIAAYLGANVVFLNFLEPNLPGLFENQRYSEVNGALWTLKIEVMFYVAVPFLAWSLTKLSRFWWIGIGGLILTGLIWREVALALNHPLSEQISRQLPGQMMYFAAGMTMWKIWQTARAHAGLLFLVGVSTLAAALLVPFFEALRPLGLFGIIAGLTFVRGPELNAARWGDVSYGVYIVHFPIVQALVGAGLFDALGLLGGAAISAAIVFPLSFLLWWWVEKPALRRDSHYRRVSEERVEEWPNTTPSNWTPPETALRS